MKAYDKGTDFPIPAAGPCPARCVQIIDLGTAINRISGKDKHEVFFGFETPTRTFEREEKGNPGVKITVPHIVGVFFGLSMSPKANLRKFVENWLGRGMSPETAKKGFDIKALSDHCGYIAIAHELKDDGSTKVKISTIMPLPKEIQMPARVSSLVYFSLDPDEFDMKVFNSLGKYFQERIQLSNEWGDLHGQPRHSAPGEAPASYTASVSAGDAGFKDDDIPF